MAPKSTAMEISAICGLFILLALWGIVWDITSGLLTSGIDGIMLLFVCAMMAGIFFLIMLMELNKSGIIPTPGFLRSAPKPVATAAAAKPAAAPATPGAKAPAVASPATAAPKPSAPAAGAPAAVPPMPANPAPAATPGVPPTGPRPAAPAPGAAGASAPAKPATAVPVEPPSVPEKK